MRGSSMTSRQITNACANGKGMVPRPDSPTTAPLFGFYPWEEPQVLAILWCSPAPVVRSQQAGQRRSARQSPEPLDQGRVYGGPGLSVPLKDRSRIAAGPFSHVAAMAPGPGD